MAATPDVPPYRADLARVHHEGFGHHAAAVAPGILRRLEPARGGLVLELGCGSGLLTRELVAAGHRVLATDASPAMLALAREAAPGAEVRRLTLPDDPLPPARAIVAVGHPLNYLADTGAVERALAACARALEPGGVLALDLCDLTYGRARTEAPPYARVADDWAIFVRFELPDERTFVRRITTFVREPDGAWRRDDEVHANALVDARACAALLEREGLRARVAPAFGGEALPEGLLALIAERP